MKIIVSKLLRSENLDFVRSEPSNMHHFSHVSLLR